MVRFAPLAFVMSIAFAAPAMAAESDALKLGAGIAKANCGSCHAVGRTGASPNPKSPPFRYLARKYPLSNLEEALGEGIVVGHEGLEMPQFRFDAKEVEALLAYLGSIQKR
ncbi:c-type cytochrome [Methylocystis parvus]|uniref:Cytochrome c n=1 Tax=Methylocystis parvus TaxID=134 RepID=A0A6B8M303_9HYPH|nr:cytochrome c [Methylocystis parvus]QGM96706.1 cytochrome c [Methylocystis parvus]WBJ99428.1 cytochrome c [Methylocystis parvus OBBP]